MGSSNAAIDRNIVYEQITRGYLEANLERFFAIESNWTELGEEAWTEDNFLLELPLKWDLSFLCKDGDGESIIGYVIGSCSKDDPSISQVNKIIVDNSYRGMGIGTKLMDLYTQACLKRGIKYSQLKALTNNNKANTFYDRLGYYQIDTVKGTDDLVRHFYEKKLGGD